MHQFLPLKRTNVLYNTYTTVCSAQLTNKSSTMIRIIDRWLIKGLKYTPLVYTHPGASLLCMHRFTISFLLQSVNTTSITPSLRAHTIIWYNSLTKSFNINSIYRPQTDGKFKHADASLYSLPKRKYNQQSFTTQYYCTSDCLLTTIRLSTRKAWTQFDSYADH